LSRAKLEGLLEAHIKPYIKTTSMNKLQRAAFNAVKSQNRLIAYPQRYVSPLTTSCRFEGAYLHFKNMAIKMPKGGEPPARGQVPGRN
jgi:hypothetical protein